MVLLIYCNPCCLKPELYQCKGEANAEEYAGAM